MMDKKAMSVLKNNNKYKYDLLKIDILNYLFAAKTKTEVENAKIINKFDLIAIDSEENIIFSYTKEKIKSKNDIEEFKKLLSFIFFCQNEIFIYPSENIFLKNLKKTIKFAQNDFESINLIVKNKNNFFDDEIFDAFK